MAVENKYVNSDLNAGKLANAAFSHGQKPFVLVNTFEVAAADDNGSIYRIAKNIDPDLIPVRIEVYNDAITSGTDYDLGLYEPLEAGGAVIDADIFANTLDMSSGAARGSAKDGLENLNIDKVQKMIYELAGHTLSTKKRGYDIAYTANTVGSAAGTISTLMFFVQG